MSDPADGAALDRGALDELRAMTGNDPVFFDEMIDTFLADGPSLTAGMRSAADAGDAVALRLAAHTLKSNCRSFGASALAELCHEIEQRAAQGDLAGIDAAIERAIACYPGVVAALDAERFGS
jgi:HPt (histidine-containing phosphotransfer) domain-containing protein